MTRKEDTAMTTNTSAGRAGVAPWLERCPVCGATYEGEQERVEHINRTHAAAVQEAIAKLSSHAQQWTLRAIEASRHSGN
jgi:uncharacterized C2H2 Zn-finger protein